MNSFFFKKNDEWNKFLFIRNLPNTGEWYKCFGRNSMSGEVKGLNNILYLLIIAQLIN